MAKLIQVYLIHQDLQMFDEDSQKRPECRALNIPEELGQVHNVLQSFFM
jgi:phospholipid-translocating ATPase